VLPSSNPAPIEVVGDRIELGSAIMNLIDNAVKYAGADGEVTIGVERHGRRAQVRVTDNGPGVPAQDIKRIFKRFYRVPGPLTQRVKGTGLGLFIVQTAARRHGGRAYATSNAPERGTTFHLDLPAVDSAAS
jgi:signal transduction histidine kinase